MNVKVWTGPCAVKQAAADLRAAGVEVSIEGTEHVYLPVPEGMDAPGPALAAARAYRRHYGKSWPYRQNLNSE